MRASGSIVARFMCICRGANAFRIFWNIDCSMTFPAFPGLASGALNSLEDKMELFATLALEHLLLRLQPLNRALRRAVKRQGELAAQLVRPDIAALCVTDDQVTKLLAEVDSRLKNTQAACGEAELTPYEEATEKQLRARVNALDLHLPLDHLTQNLKL